MLNFFSKKKVETAPNACKVDIHSHLIPAIDDGAKSIEESLELIRAFCEMGYTKLITTPHIMHDFYDNDENDILTRLATLQEACVKENIDIELEAAAEYYLDENLYDRIASPNEKFLTFGKNCILFETAFMSEPLYLRDFIFKVKTRGMNPVLAHPERYTYLHSKMDVVDDLRNRGVLLQLNINSLSGYYSKPVKKFAEQLIDQKKIDFIGSDCHNLNHLKATKISRETKYYRRALQLPLLNFEL